MIDDDDYDKPYLVGNFLCAFYLCGRKWKAITWVRVNTGIYLVNYNYNGSMKRIP